MFDDLTMTTWMKFPKLILHVILKALTQAQIKENICKIKQNTTEISNA